MRAMILAAGLGKRMGQLTQHIPKPLLTVGNHYLIEYPLIALKKAGISDVIINVHYHAEKIKEALGTGERYGMHLFYSEESTLLETGGGIFHVLPFFEKKPFIVVSSDIISDYEIAKLPRDPLELAHLVLVSNPPYHLEGDFGLSLHKIDCTAQPKLTFGNIAVYRTEFFERCQAGCFRLTNLLFPAIARGVLTGEHYQGLWYNIGTPEELATVNQRAREDSNLRPLVSETNTLST